MTSVAIDLFGGRSNQIRYPKAAAPKAAAAVAAAPRWIQPPPRPFRWRFNPNILVDIFYDKNSAPLDVDLSTRLGNTNLVVSLSNPTNNNNNSSRHSNALAIAPASPPAATEIETAAAQAPPPPPPPPPPPQPPKQQSGSSSGAGNQITIDTNGEYINANIIVPLRYYRHHGHHNQRRCYPSHQPRPHRISNRFSNLIVDQFINQATPVN